MDTLSELHACLSAAATDKLAERKKQVEILRKLIHRLGIQRALDNNFGKGDRLKWDNVLKQLSNIINLELESLQKTKPAEKTKANHAKKLAQVGQLYRTVVQIADARGPQLNPRPVVRHIVNKLEETFAREVVGGEYLDILKKYIFTQQAYLPQISQKLYQQILNCCIELYKEKEKIKRILVSEVIRCTVLQASRYTDINLTPLIQFFSQTFKDCKGESWPILQNLVRSMNLVCSQRLTDSRIQIAALGENVHANMLWLWNKYCAQLKECLVEFWTYQMAVHHPGGAKDADHGAYALDWTSWKNQLNKLYAVLYTDVQQVSGRSKFGTNQNIHLSDQYIRLCADVCHQVFTDVTSVLEITQLFDVDPTASTSSSNMTQPRSKRQRLESGWEVLRDLVFPTSVTISVIPWVQLLNSLCERYSTSIPGDEVGNILSALQTQIQNPKIADVTIGYLRCLDTMVTNWTLIAPNLDSFNIKNCTITWHRIVPSAQRLIGLHHAEEHAYRLMTSLEKSGLVEVDTSWWRVFCGSVTHATVGHLMHLIQRHDIPVSLNQSANGIQSESFRDELYDWLLPELSQQLDESGNLIGAKDVDPFKLAAVLVFMTFRDPFRNGLQKIEPIYSLSDHEAFLLNCSFDQFKIDVKDPHIEDQEAEGYNRNISSLVKKLETLVLRDCRFFMELQEYTFDLVMRLIRQCGLVIGCTYMLAYYDVISRSTNPSTCWVDMIKSLMKKLEKHLAPVLTAEPTAVCSLLRLLASLYNLEEITSLVLSQSRDQVTLHSRDRECREFMSQVLVLATPASILEKLQSLTERKSQVGRPKPPEMSRAGTSHSTTSHDPDEFDMDWDLSNDSTNAQEAATNEFPDLPEQTVSVGDLQDRFAESCLNDQEKILIAATRTLCRFVRMASSGERTPLGSPGGSQSPVARAGWRDKLAEVKGFLLDQVDNENVDWALTVNLQMVYCIMSELLEEKPPFLLDEDISSLLDVIKELCKHHRRDSEVCRAAVTMVANLIPHLADDTGRSCSHDERPGSHGDGMEVASSTKRQSREVLMHVLTLLWKLQLPQEGTCDNFSFGVRTRIAILDCMQKLVQYDASQSWTIWSDWARDDRTRNLGETAADALLLGLGDPSHQVRIFTARNVVQWLFIREKDGLRYPLDREEQNNIFRNLYEAMKDVMSVQTGLTVLCQRDESVNRASCVLHVIQTTIVHSAICRKKATFIFFLLIKEYNIDKVLVMKVMSQTAAILGFASLNDYVIDHVPYIVDKWLNLKYSIWDFPFTVLGCEDRLSFYSQYQEIVLPLLRVYDQLDALNAMAELMRETLPQLLSRNLTPVLTHMLPCMALPARSPSRGQEAQKQFDWLEEQLTRAVIEEIISDNLEDLVVRLLRLILIERQTVLEADSEVAISVPEMNPPFYPAAMISASLEYLVKSLVSVKVRGQQGRVRSLVALLAKSQNGLQKVLLSLKTDLYRSSGQRIYAWYHGIHAYGFFIRSALQDVTALGNRWPFVLRDVIYTLVHCMKRLLHISTSLYSGVVSACFLHCVGLLGHVIEVGASQRILLLGEFLPVIIDALVDSINQRACKKCVEILDLLICRHGDALRSSIALLDPLPWQQSSLSPWKSAKTAGLRDQLVKLRKMQDRFKYEQTDWNLAKELEHFLMVGEQRHEISARIEGLKFLAQVLSNRKSELLALQQQSSESRDQTLARLLCVLLDMMKTAHRTCKSDDDVKSKGAMNKARMIELCCQCLGEIGPVDMSLLVVSEPSHASVRTAPVRYYNTRKQTTMARNYQIVHALDKCLLSDCIDTIHAAHDVIRAVLTRPDGSAFFLQYQKDVIAKEWSHSMVQYLQHFLPDKKKLQAPAPVAASLNEISETSLWCAGGLEYATWIRKLVSAIIRSGYVLDSVLNAMLPVCSTQTEFSALILPYLIHDLLLRDDETLTALLSRQFRLFFSTHRDIADRENSRATTPSSDNIPEDSVCGDKQSIDCLLNVIHYLRQQDRPKRGRSAQTVWENNFWLDVNYLDLSRAAQYCGRHFTAVMYAEIWCDMQKSGVENEDDAMSSSQSSVHNLSILTHESRNVVMNVLLESYKAIGDPDGVYGCDLGRLADPMVRIKTYEHEARWDKALSGYDLEMEANDLDVPRLSTQLGILNSLNQYGLSHVLATYMRGLSWKGHATDHDLQSVQYQAALKCGQWDLHVPSRITGRPEYHRSVYGSICSLRDKDLKLFKLHLSSARLACVERLGSFQLLSSNRVYHLLSDLQSLSQLEDAAHVITGSTNVQTLLTKWREQSRTLRNTDYLHTEAVFDTRVTLLQVLHSVMTGADDLREGLMLQIQEQVRLATQAERYQTAARSIRSLNELVSGELQTGAQSESLSTIKYDTNMDEARMFWCRGETNTGLAMMAAAIKRARMAAAADVAIKRKYAEMLIVQGEWLAQVHAESPLTIMDDYLYKGVRLLEDCSEAGSEACVHAHSTLALYADTQYEHINDYMTSSVYENKVALTRKAKEEAEQLADIKSKGGDAGRYVKLLEDNIKLDEREMESTVQSQCSYLLKAVQSYIRCLVYSGRHDLRIFRLISLWFDNSERTEINASLKEAITQVSSHKFLPMMYQLAARMSVQHPQSQKTFQNILTQLMLRCCSDHPHHSLAIVLALAHGDLDREFICQPGTNKRSQKSKIAEESKEDRAIASSRLLNDLRSGPRREVIEQMEKLSRAYIELANMRVDKQRSNAVKMLSSWMITQIKNMTAVAIPTDMVKVDPLGRYEDVVTVHSFEPTFSLAGGINLPKIITCTGTDGRKRKQLVKGRDDLRQDAVMQQVFGMVNTLLNKDPETRRRNLDIRTYKIIPLSQRSGVLEWCEGTQPLGEYLIGSGREGAHSRYRHEDLPAVLCRNTIKDAACKSSQERLEAYLDVCRRFKPVLRHFFLENFPDPATWYERRLAYTRSVATNSIVGYILGLGDRHVQNILIDTQTAELVHIDLGVAFEQGKLLPTPETVPFRLTRDIVDGMGVTGVEGVFRRCCEKTLSVMRDSRAVLITILEVLLYDPLYRWSMSPLKAYLVQHRKEKQDDEQDLNTTANIMDDNAGSSDMNKTAERVLLRLKQKLQGVELGVQMNISGQVNKLIQEAMDPNNLCRLYCGWQPYL